VSPDKRSRSRQEADAIWATALRVAAGVARRATDSEEEMLRSVTEELQQINLLGGIAYLGQDGLLEIHSTSFTPRVQGSIKRMTGLDIIGYRFDPKIVKLYRKALAKKQAVYGPDRSEPATQAGPAPLRPLLDRIMGLLGRDPIIVAPLLVGDRTLGALNVTADWLRPEDAPMVMGLADHIAIALDHVRSREEMQAALERERLSNLVVEAVASPLDLPVVLERVIQLATQVTHADAGAIALIDPSGDTVHFPYIYGLPESLKSESIPRGEGLTWQVIETREPILLPDYQLQSKAQPSWIQAGLRAFFGVPLIVGDEIIGAMGLFALQEESSFQQDHVEMGLAIARVSAIAIKNASLFAEATRRAEEAQTLMRTSRSISASLDVDTVLETIATEAMSLLQADGSCIHILEDGEARGIRCLIAHGPDAEALVKLTLEPGQGLVGYVIESEKPLLVNDPVSDPRSVQVPGTAEDEPECLALAPLQIRQNTVGVMTVRRLGHDRPFQMTELNLLTAFAAQAAIAIDNAHLFGQIHSQAQRLEVEVVERTRDLSISEARYRALVESSMAGTYQVDAQGRFVYLSNSFSDLLGRPTEDLIGSVAWLVDVVTEESRKEVKQRFQARIKGKLPPREACEIELVHASGRHIPCIMTTSLIVNEDGEPQGATGIALDISDRKALEAALRTERDRLDAILSNIGDAVYVTDSQGVIEYVNPAWERMSGYTAEEAIGQTGRILRSGVHEPSIFDELWQTVLRGEPWQGELVNRRKDGSTFEVSLIIHPLLDYQGRVINMVGVHHDISALKKLDRLKTQFISDASHELRTPLTNIRLYLDLLNQTEDRGKANRYLETLSRESDRLADLVDDLLSISRLESGTASFEPAAIDLNQLLAALVDDRRALASERDLTLDIKPARGLPSAMGDIRLLSQVFTNLLTNAMNYTLPGDKITLRTRHEKIDGGQWVVAEVEDTGLGISPDELPLIFQRFFRGRASQVAHAPGTGLGLAICKEIVEQHDGCIEAESVQGKYTRFTVRLPMASEAKARRG
jgi:PAS domain S-box-containing protein